MVNSERCRDHLRGFRLITRLFRLSLYAYTSHVCISYSILTSACFCFSFWWQTLRPYVLPVSDNGIDGLLRVIRLFSPRVA